MENEMPPAQNTYAGRRVPAVADSVPFRKSGGRVQGCRGRRELQYEE